MQRFNFRLQRVLEVKETIQELRERELGEAVRKLEHEKNIKVRLMEQMTSVQEILRDKLNEPTSPYELMVYYNYMAMVRSIIFQQEKKIQKAQEEVHKRNEKLIEAYKEREIIDRLKERYKGEYIENTFKEEQSFIDEVSNASFFKNRDLKPISNDV